jgi:hypothetical protein
VLDSPSTRKGHNVGMSAPHNKQTVTATTTQNQNDCRAAAEKNEEREIGSYVCLLSVCCLSLFSYKLH